MRKAILFWVAGGLVLLPAAEANAQTSAPTGPVGSGVRSQDVAAGNRQTDNDYNTLAGRGVEVTNMDRKGASKRRSAVPATASDVKAGAQIRDVKGVSVGVVATLAANEIADPDSVVVDTGQTKIGVPLSAFGKDDKGLLLSITAQAFKQLVAQTNAGAKGTQSN